jgi:hypothetical protein
MYVQTQKVLAACTVVFVLTSVILVMYFINKFSVFTYHTALLQCRAVIKV